MAEATSPGQLSRLVRDTRAKLKRVSKTGKISYGLPLRDLAARCPIVAPAGTLDLRTGRPLPTTLNYTWIRRLELGEMREAPSAIELEALARGLELPSDTVKLAAGAQYFALHLTPIEHPDRPGEMVEVLIERMDEMSPGQLARLIRYAENVAQRHAAQAPDAP
ncbi:hypothetical protein [Streptacidiphilus sp. EB129]|uniref:hypothetical protein n=1 Tax=Streptacidiphilus sp. EB129 TaxID=3156262 RepID=UPI003512986A